MSKKATKKTVNRKPYDGNDAKVIANIFAPGYPPQEFTFTVANIKGNATAPKRRPVDVAGAIMGGLRRFGRVS